jgi:glycosyltransferase involved in cell wall biosynthesis
VVRHAANQGVGGAVLTGYRQALAAGADVIVKLDGDGQMDPALIDQFVAPIAEGRADYVKGNRFHNIEDVRAMPAARLLGNAALSFLTKLSAGYWHVFDPTNGYTAIAARVARALPAGKIARRYFFESDMLFRLGTLNACVLDLPMQAVYADERSNMSLLRILPEFIAGHLRNFGKRLFYNYFLRGFSVASLQLLLGLALLPFGMAVGLAGWWDSWATGVPATTGTVILAALPVLLGVQFLLSFLSFDMAAVPQRPVGPLLPPRAGAGEAPPCPVAAVERCGRADAA